MKKYALALDVLFLLLFVGIGRNTHQHSITVSGMASTLWPFLTGLLVGWFVVWRLHRAGSLPVNGLLIVLMTVSFGMILRVLSGQGTVLAFIIVAFAFLTLFLVGWRLISQIITRRG